MKVEITVKNNIADRKEKIKDDVEEKIEINEEQLKKARENIEQFLNEFLNAISEKIKYEISEEKGVINVTITGDDATSLIGYRGESLNSLQTIITNIASKNIEEKVKVILDIANYKDARRKTLEDLAVKIEKTVTKTGKQVTLEPMTSYERKIIHTKLQDSEKVRTYSIGEGDKRRVVIANK